mmetsp:Transcript_1966/g.5439  ORF Transcript_1966/g.5439 Transcript_1966/m.5439 type:complete len:252 (-) Transcript_1966:220-975(-)
MSHESCSIYIECIPSRSRLLVRLIPHKAFAAVCCGCRCRADGARRVPPIRRRATCTLPPGHLPAVLVCLGRRGPWRATARPALSGRAPPVALTRRRTAPASITRRRPAPLSPASLPRTSARLGRPTLELPPLVLPSRRTYGLDDACLCVGEPWRLSQAVPHLVEGRGAGLVGLVGEVCLRPIETLAPHPDGTTLLGCTHGVKHANEVTAVEKGETEEKHGLAQLGLEQVGDVDGHVAAVVQDLPCFVQRAE